MYHLPNIIRVVKNNLVKHVARVGKQEGCIEGLVGKSEGKNHLEDLDVDGRIILK
jgi:hypothetical protein